MSGHCDVLIFTGGADMRGGVGAVISGLAIVGVVMFGVVAPVGATASGRERFDGFLLASATAGQRQVRASGVVASGVFNGHGRIVEVDSQPGDPDNVLRDDLVFADGVMHLVSVGLDFSFDVDPRTCSATFLAHQTGTVEGGTRRFAHASGQFTGTVNGHGLVGRLPDGTCDVNQGPLVELDVVAASGTLSF